MMEELDNVAEEHELRDRERIFQSVIAKVEKGATTLIQTLNSVKGELLQEWTTQDAARTGPSAEIRSEILSRPGWIHGIIIKAAVDEGGLVPSSEPNWAR